MPTTGLNSQALGGIYYTANSNKNVADPLDKYQSLRPLWDRARAVVQGCLLYTSPSPRDS